MCLQALIHSNEHLINEVSELKAQHALDAAAFQKNFDELAAELARTRALATPLPTDGAKPRLSTTSAAGAPGQRAPSPRQTASADPKKASAVMGVRRPPPVSVKGKEN